MKKSKEQSTNATVAEGITTNEAGQPIVNGAVQISVSDKPKATLGRPKKEGSKRQQKLAEIEAKRAANDGYLPLGRPKMEGSKRQLELLAKAEAKASGVARGIGRPKMSEEDKAIAKEKREKDRQEWLAKQALKAEGVQVSEAVTE